MMAIVEDLSGNSPLDLGNKGTDEPLFGNLSHSEVFRDYLIPGLSARTGASAPDLVSFRDGLYLLAFDGNATLEQAFFSLHILHDIKIDEDDPEATPTFHVHWTHNTLSPSGNVKWQVELTLARGYGKDAYPASQTISSVQAAPAQYVHQITPDDDMPLPSSFLVNLEPDSQLIGRIFRDPSDVEDTFANDAMLIGIDLHYKANKLGTFERNRPFNSAGINVTGA